MINAANATVHKFVSQKSLLNSVIVWCSVTCISVDVSTEKNQICFTVNTQNTSERAVLLPVWSGQTDNFFYRKDNNFGTSNLLHSHNWQYSTITESAQRIDKLCLEFGTPISIRSNNSIKAESENVDARGWLTTYVQCIDVTLYVWRDESENITENKLHPLKPFVTHYATCQQHELHTSWVCSSLRWQT